MMRYIYIILGLIFSSLGTIGVILPVLPTTPFLLLALACFSKGSERFNDYFKNTKLYKNNLEEFVVNRSMTLRNKTRILTFASTMLLITYILVNKPSIRIFIACVIMYKYYYFTFHIETIEESEVKY